MNEYDRIVECVDGGDMELYFNMETGEFIDIGYAEQVYILVHKHILFGGSFLEGKEEDTLYPTGNCYILCKQVNRLVKNESGHFISTKDASLDDTGPIYPAINTPGDYNNCLIYSILLVHPKMNVNILDEVYISKLKKEFLDYTIIRSVDDAQPKDINYEESHTPIHNSKIPKNLTSGSSISSLYLKQMLGKDDKILPSNIFDICSNRFADFDIVGKYAAEFFGINITCHVKGYTKPVNIILDEKWDTIHIYLSRNHFSGVCRRLDNGTCSTRNVISLKQ